VWGWAPGVQRIHRLWRISTKLTKIKPPIIEIAFATVRDQRMTLSIIVSWGWLETGPPPNQF